MKSTFESVSKVVALCVVENAIELRTNEVWIVEVLVKDLNESFVDKQN